MRNFNSYFILVTILACKPEPDPQPTPEPVDPCKIIPGTNLYFGDLIYKFDENGWPTYITSNDTVNGQGSNYRSYKYSNNSMVYTELSLDNGNFWNWDSLNCNGSNCTHFFAQSDSSCNTSQSPCYSEMALNIGNWVLSDGATNYHYNNLMALDSISYSNSTFHLNYFQGKISQIIELNLNRDTLATQTFTFNKENQWRAFERNDFVTGFMTEINYAYDSEGKLSMVSVHEGVSPVVLIDYPVTQEGCGELQRNLDPLNLYRLPHMNLKYIGLPW